MTQTGRNLIYFRGLYSVNSQSWCIADVPNRSGSPQPQNYTAAASFRFNWLWSILDNTIRAASNKMALAIKSLTTQLTHESIHFPPNHSTKCIHTVEVLQTASLLRADRLLSTGEVYSSSADYIQIDRQLQNMQNLRFRNSYYTFCQRGLHSSSQARRTRSSQSEWANQSEWLSILWNFLLWWTLEWIRTKNPICSELIWLRFLESSRFFNWSVSGDIRYLTVRAHFLNFNI